MTEDKARTLIGLSVVELTRHLMSQGGLPREKAFSMLLRSRTYDLLNNPDSRMYLEDDDFLCRCLDAERHGGSNALFSLINQ